MIHTRGKTLHSLRPSPPVHPLLHLALNLQEEEEKEHSRIARIAAVAADRR